MSTPQLELRLLKSIPAKFKKAKDKIYDQDPPGLERAYGQASQLRDNWHIELRIRSRYCSTSELQGWLMVNYPGISFSSWSWNVPGPGQNILVRTHERDIEISWDQYEKLMTDHIDPVVFEYPTQAWNIDLDSGDGAWLAPVLPDYIGVDTIMKLTRMRLEYARKSRPESRADRISMAGYSGTMAPDIIGFLADGWAEANHTRTTLYASLVD